MQEHKYQFELWDYDPSEPPPERLSRLRAAFEGHERFSGARVEYLETKHEKAPRYTLVVPASNRLTDAEFRAAFEDAMQAAGIGWKARIWTEPQQPSG